MLGDPDILFVVFEVQASRPRGATRQSQVRTEQTWSEQLKIALDFVGGLVGFERKQKEKKENKSSKPSPVTRPTATELPMIGNTWSLGGARHTMFLCACRARSGRSRVSSGSEGCPCFSGTFCECGFIFGNGVMPDVWRLAFRSAGFGNVAGCATRTGGEGPRPRHDTTTLCPSVSRVDHPVFICT